MSRHAYVQFSSHPWMNGDHTARTMLKTVSADGIKAHDFYSGSDGRTMALIWEETDIVTKMQVVYVAVTTSFVRL